MYFKYLSKEQKPREKAIKYGLETLSDLELLAIILRTGYKECDVLNLAHSIITKFHGLENINKANFKTLTEIKGIGKSKALELLSCFELSKRVNFNKGAKINKIFSPKDVYLLLFEKLNNLKQEHFYLILLNNNNVIIHQSMLYKGTIDSINIDFRDILHTSLMYKCSKIVLVHNHPSGDSTPSPADIITTKELEKRVNFFNLQLLDHVIIGNNNCFSINSDEKIRFSMKKYLK